MGEIHSLTGASAAVCGWNRGRVFFFFSPCAAVDIHSLTRASGGAFFFFAVCAAVDIHSLTGASGGDSLTHWRVRGRVFFFAPCAAGEIHSLTGASAAVCGWNIRVSSQSCLMPTLQQNQSRTILITGFRSFFLSFFLSFAFLFFSFFLRARRAKQKKKNTGRVFFLSFFGTRRAFLSKKKNFFFFLERAERGAIFFLLRARRGKFTHSLARPRLCVLFLEQTRRPGARFDFMGHPCAVGGNSLQN